MMNSFWLLFLPLLYSSLQAAPSDTELLKMVRHRTQLERITKEPVDMEKAAAILCRVASNASNLPDLGPHAKAALHVFANEPAVLPIFDPWAKFPAGSLVLKEKLSRETSESQLFTGMWKRESGYFPEAGDWEFFTVDAAAERVLERGKLESCAKCHQEHAKGDFVTKLYAAPTQLTNGTVVLHSSKAISHGEKLHYEDIEKKNTLGFWVNAADWAEWKFSIATPGKFDVHLWQGCGKGSGGSEVEILSDRQSVKFIVEDTGHFQNFKERVVGALAYEMPGPQTLEVRVRTKPGAAVMDLRQILLVPKR